MILQTLASLVILAATAAPGRVFESGIDKHRPRHFRSTFAEYIELVMIGAATTVGAAVIVVLIGGAFGELDLDKLVPHPKEYLHEEPWRVAIASATTLGVSFLLAFSVPQIAFWVAKRAKGKKDEAQPDDYYEHSAWLNMFKDAKPGGKKVAVAAQFKDGYKAVGILAGFTPTQVEDRELLLEKLEIGSTKTPLQTFPDHNFLIVRESQISWMVCEYVGKSS